MIKIYLFILFCFFFNYRIILITGCNGPNEEFTNCGTACPNTCLNKSIRRPCIDICIQGCFCKQGLVRKGWDMSGGIGECIPTEQCESLIRDSTNNNNNNTIFEE